MWLTCSLALSRSRAVNPSRVRCCGPAMHTCAPVSATAEAVMRAPVFAQLTITSRQAALSMSRVVGAPLTVMALLVILGLLWVALGLLWVALREHINAKCPVVPHS